MGKIITKKANASLYKLMLLILFQKKNYIINICIIWQQVIINFFSNFEVEIYSLNSVFGNLGISANEK